MIRHGLPPPSPCVSNLPLPSTRGSAGLRQRPVPSRGGQLQVGGVVVGSWGANYGYGGSAARQAPLVGGYQGRGRGQLLMNSNFPPQSPSYQPQQQQQDQQAYWRGRQPRKQGPPTYNVKKNNVSREKNVSLAA